MSPALGSNTIVNSCFASVSITSSTDDCIVIESHYSLQPAPSSVWVDEEVALLRGRNLTSSLETTTMAEGLIIKRPLMLTLAMQR